MAKKPRKDKSWLESKKLTKKKNHGKKKKKNNNLNSKAITKGNDRESDRWRLLRRE
jgi:hypothetical protein